MKKQTTQNLTTIKDIVRAWWKPDNADFMLALRVLRANEQWDKYWMAAQNQTEKSKHF